MVCQEHKFLRVTNCCFDCFCLPVCACVCFGCSSCCVVCACGGEEAGAATCERSTVTFICLLHRPAPHQLTVAVAFSIGIAAVSHGPPGALFAFDRSWSTAGNGTALVMKVVERPGKRRGSALATKAVESQGKGTV